MNSGPDETRGRWFPVPPTQKPAGEVRSQPVAMTEHSRAGIFTEAGLQAPQRTGSIPEIKMKRPNFGSRKPRFKTQLAVASLPVALLLARGLLGHSPTSAWSQNNDLDVPTGRIQPAAAAPANPTPPPAAALPPVLPPLESAAPPVPAPPQPEFNNPVPLTLQPLEQVAPPSGELTGVAPGSELAPVPGGLLPPGRPGTEDANAKPTDDGLGIYSPLYEGAGFSRSVFTPAYIPASSYSAPEARRYRSLWGSPTLERQLHADLAVEFNDNINLGDKGNRKADVAITPAAGMGLRWRPGGNQEIELNLGVGYRWYLNHSELNSVIITPSTRAQYNFRVGSVNPVKLNVHDYFSTAIDPTSEGQIGAASVNPNQLLNYRRILNTLGIGAEWQASSSATLNAGYDYKVDRTLTDQFRALDHDEHTFSAGISYKVSDPLTLGFAGNYTIIDYTQNLQNGGTIWSFGPSVRYEITRNITFNGSVGYAYSSFDRPSATSIQDTSNFRSVTYQASLRHNFREHWAHELSATRGASLGIGNNFADYTAIQYGIHYGRLDSRLRAHALLTWEDFKVSGLGGESANRYLLYLGVRYQLTASLSSGLGYSYALKESNVAGLDYYQNRIILDATYQF